MDKYKGREADYHREYYQSHKEQEAARQRSKYNAEERHDKYVANKEATNYRTKKYYEENREKILQQQREKHKKDPRLSMLAAAKHRATKAHLPFSITLDDIIIPITCPVLGIPIIVGGRKATPNSPTIDRFAPSTGYVKGNIVVISYRANSLKRDETDPEVFEKLAVYLRR